MLVPTADALPVTVRATVVGPPTAADRLSRSVATLPAAALMGAITVGLIAKPGAVVMGWIAVLSAWPGSVYAPVRGFWPDAFTPVNWGSASEIADKGAKATLAAA